MSAIIGFAIAPPNNPECLSVSGPITSISKPKIPLKPTAKFGSLSENCPPSAEKIMSHLSLSTLFETNSGIFGEAISSSPSKRNFILKGKVPLLL